MEAKASRTAGILRSAVIAGAFGFAVGCQTSPTNLEPVGSRGTLAAMTPESAEPLPAGRLAVYRHVLLKSRVSALRVEAAGQLGAHRTDDRESVWAISLALRDEDRAVREAAHTAIREILDARPRAKPDEKARLEALRDSLDQRARQAGLGAIELIEWLWENVYFWPPVAELAAEPLIDATHSKAIACIPSDDAGHAIIATRQPQPDRKT